MSKLKVLVLGDIDRAAQEVFKSNKIDVVQMRCVFDPKTLNNKIINGSFNAVLVANDTPIENDFVVWNQMIKVIGAVGRKQKNVSAKLLSNYGIPFMCEHNQNPQEELSQTAHHMAMYLRSGLDGAAINLPLDPRFKRQRYHVPLDQLRN